jgi:site-specific DNA-methyltransferase (adenine-specific)
MVLTPYYQRNGITIFNGDCISILQTFKTGSVAGVITDPPYSLSASSNRRSANKPMGWADINNASHWFTTWYKEVWRILSKDGCLWTFCSWRTLPVVQCAASRIGGMYITSVVVWDKDWPGVGSTRGVRESFEMLALFAKPDFRIQDRKLRNIWTIPWSSQRPNGHPSEKPEALINKILQISNLTGLILDPFCGSGTIGASATNRGLKFTGIDIEESWAEYTKTRLIENQSHQLKMVVA